MVAIADNPIAPQPMTIGTSLLVNSDRRATDQPTAIASDTHTTSLGRSEWTTFISDSSSKRYSPNPPGVSGFWPMIFMPPPANITGRELTRVPTGMPRSVSGP